MNTISAFDQYAQRGVKIFALIGAIERIGEQHDLAAIGRADGVGVGAEYVATEFGQRAPGADAGEFFEQAAQHELRFRRLASGASRDASAA